MSVDLTKGATVELVKTLSDDLRTKNDNTKYSSAGAAMRDKANVDGYYENLVSGGTEQILSSVFEEDNEPYLFRTSGGSIDIGDREEDTIVGGTVAWNQLVIYGKFPTGSWGASQGTISVNDGEATVTGTGNYAQIGSAISLVSGHKYLAIVDAKSSDGVNVSIGSVSFTPNHKYFATTSAYQTIGRVYTASSPLSTQIITITSNNGNSKTYTVKNPQVFDLTQMFGTTIADYIDSLEQANAGDGVAWFKKYFPNDYYAYDAGTLKSVEGLQSHDMVGFNQIDISSFAEKYPTYCSMSGDVLNVTAASVLYYEGVEVNIPADVAGAYIKYDVKCGTASNARTRIVYADGTVENVGGTVSTSWVTVTKKLSNKFIKYVRFNWSTVGTFQIKDFCINLSWDGERDGEYEPYVKHSYPLDDSLTLRGIPKLDDNNKLYYDGDVYKADGTVERKYGIVDLGTLNWESNTSGVFYAMGRVLAYKRDASSKAVCSKYIFNGSDNTSVSVNNKPDKTIYLNLASGGGEWVFVKDTSYTSAVDFKSAMSSVYLVYELATPTTEEAQPYQTPQIVEDFGTEEYVTDSIVPVGHVTKYMPNLKAKLEMAPDSPSDNGDYIVRHTNGLNEYVPLVIPTELPTMPTDTNGSYKLVCTVTNGVATMSWETDE